jgi:N-succinyldiaminopimelate aminotransferase
MARREPPLTSRLLAAVARLCVDRDLLAVTDEVYEHLVFDGEAVERLGKL